MIKDFKYILKRIFIGVSIALILGFIKGNLLIGVSAKAILSHAIGTQINTVGNLTTSVYYDVSGNPFLNRPSGTITFSFSIYKLFGNPTSPIVMARDVMLHSEDSLYACSLGTASLTNSTFGGTVYSASCPVTFVQSRSLKRITINLMDSGPYEDTSSSYRVFFNGLITYVSDDEFSTSGTTDAVNSQTQTITNNNNQNTQSIINNQNSNKQDLVNNNNQNTQSIINNQNNNTQSTNNTIKEQFQSCRPSRNLFDKNNANILNASASASIVSSDASKTLYIPIDPNTTYSVSKVASVRFNTGTTESVPVIGSVLMDRRSFSTATSVTFTSSANAHYLVVYYYNPSATSLSEQQILDSIQIEKGEPTTYEPFGDVCSNRLDDNTDAINNVNNTLNNDNVDSQQAGDFFSNFQSNNHGLSGVITAPLRLINSLTTASCSPLQFQLPIIHNQVSLPCMRSIYENYFGVFFSLYQLITTGLICYCVMINLYSKIHNLQNPNNDRIEVLNL